MNKVSQLLLLLLLLALAASCTGKHRSTAQKAEIAAKDDRSPQVSGDTLAVDPDQSIVHWKGTKMKGTGKHEGVIKLRDAYFIADSGRIQGGHFTMAMNTIEATDIPEHEPIPRKRLNDHLKSADFFAVQQYPTASFAITKVEQTGTDSLKISGNLSIKNVTKHISFDARRSGKQFSTTFTFDRFQWDIGYQGSWADRTFVDEDVELTIVLVTE